MSGTVLIVPGFRGEVAGHWQSLLAADLTSKGRAVRSLKALGRDNLTLAGRLSAMNEALASIDGQVVLVAHSGGVMHLLKWAEQAFSVGERNTRSIDSGRIAGAVLATPADFERAMPEGYPTIEALQEAGWLPIPRMRLPFPSIVAASQDDPLAAHERVMAMAKAWGSRVHDLGKVGHLNPASGFGPWLAALDLIDQFCSPTPSGRP